ncbi:hypothetical protein LMOSLCC2482_1672 [Listeria monocytogenes serotype 7 str. SLCC2482]|nr:hypothetical protein LMOSLCC2482_1672 [Listeria monocytogenes serotype 7 str. SLCC2482]CBY49213.1 hypothetical protein LMOSLCC2755_1621 [Listeria monocytogenes SLCC2755]CBY67691.1 hypothetical protein LMOL312_1613 [Listeria monocytogenes L312]CBY70522.1 hypothetical protein LMOATCC19117_1623 [Listeria monocytogenes ATCC 19117]CBY73396.1 hypothetical protein LMOSLCC2378_1629 [Listeria monocytogenes SLCC2378]CBY76332.1 hypothetical protein LMOSLCC2540_1691 [Listeria monocytogenes SLCC2540]
MKRAETDIICYNKRDFRRKEMIINGKRNVSDV